MNDIAPRPSSYAFEELMACARGEMFGPGNAQLPAPPMLLFDRITHIDDHGGQHGKGYIEAEFDINPSLWFFDCHFIGDPVMPGSLGLDALWQLVGFYLGWIGGKGSGRALGVIGIPGDRRDEDLLAVGRLASKLDRVIVRDDKYRRGRAPGEISRIIAEGRREGGMHEDSIDIMHNETEALELAMSMMQDNDLVFVLADEVPVVLEQVRRLASSHA